MPDVRFKIDTGDLDKALGKLLAGSGKAGQAALLAEAEGIMTKAKQLTPVDTGALRSSGTVTLGKDAGKPSVELAFGGAAHAYALFVHERLDVFHPVGQAKFLETAINEWRGGGGPASLGARIAKGLT